MNAGPPGRYVPPEPPPVPPIIHDSNQEVRVRRGELREWATEVERAMRSPMEAPGMWKSAGIGVSIAAVFFAGGLAVAYTGKNAPQPSAWVVVPTLFLFVVGILIFVFTEQVDREAKAAGISTTKGLADKIRFADSRSPLEGSDEATPEA